MKEILTATNYSTQGTLSGSNEESILEKTLTSKDGKYKIPVSEIYSGSLAAISEDSNVVTITYKVETNNGIFANNGTSQNIVKYINGEIQSGTYTIPKYPSGSFKKWYTTSTFNEGTEFDINSYTGGNITVYAKCIEQRARINIRSMYRDLHDGYATLNEDGTYKYGNINSAGSRIKSLVVAIRQAAEIPSWAVGKNWNDNLGRNDIYAWLGGSNMGDSSTIYSLPILAWYDVQNRILYWYSEDNSPIIYYNYQYGTTCGCNSFSSLTDISGMQNWDFSEMDMIEGFFQGCSKLTNIEPIRYWNVSNVTNMKNAFREMSNLQDASPINDWEIGKVTNFQEMFRNTPGKPTFTKVVGTFSNNGTFEPN